MKTFKVAESIEHVLCVADDQTLSTISDTTALGSFKLEMGCF